MSRQEATPIARALGRIPCGLYIVTLRSSGPDAAPMGFLGSFVMQVGFEPPSVSVAIAKGRPHLVAVRSSESFCLSILDAQSSGLMVPFFKTPPPGSSPFDGLDTRTTASGSLLMSAALAWLDCRLTGTFETGDHVVVFGEVIEGELLREGDPKVHLRRDGLGY
jgi:flavin reductase (DIM6/NTAB) family NADH-FMN oxidoreductase RutF